jgi:toxin-antitoxin system PIN domain toxin
MISFFPDINVWLALSVDGHRHNAEARRWMDELPSEVLLVFSRYTQLGLLRLLTNQTAMAERLLTLRQAWDAYDVWREDPRVEFYPEPLGMETAFREATAPHETKSASKWIGDGYLLAYARGCDATLVTFDQALYEFGRKRGYRVIVPG